MRKCQDCSDNINSRHKNAILCELCAYERALAYGRRYHWLNRENVCQKLKRWYIDNRKNNPDWKEENKRRAKAWRKDKRTDIEWIKTERWRRRRRVMELCQEKS